MSKHRKLRSGQDASETPAEVREALQNTLHPPTEDAEGKSKEMNAAGEVEQILFCRPPLSVIAMMNKDHVLVVILTSVYMLLVFGVITFYEVYTYRRYHWILIWIGMALVCTFATFLVALKSGLYAYGIITNLRIASVIPRKYPFFVKPVVQSTFFKPNFQRYSKINAIPEEQESRVESLLKVIHSRNEENAGRIIAFGNPTIHLENIQDIDVVEDTLTSIVHKIANELEVYSPKKLELKRLQKFKNEKDYKNKMMPFVIMRYIVPAITAVIIWASAIYSWASINESSFTNVFPVVVFFTVPFYFVTFIVVLLRPITQDLEAIREERSFQIGYFLTEQEQEPKTNTSVSMWA